MEFTRFADLAKRPGHPKMDRSRRLPLANAPGLAFIRYSEVVGNVQFVMEPKLVVNAGRVYKKGVRGASLASLCETGRERWTGI